MANFNKKSLRYGYSWTIVKENDNSKIIGFPDDAILDSNEGYEVLPFINKYMSSRKWAYESTFHNIEQTIKEHLPDTVRNHKHIKEWLDDNFQLYQFRDSAAQTVSGYPESPKSS